MVACSSAFRSLAMSDAGVRRRISKLESVAHADFEAPECTQELVSSCHITCLSGSS